MASPSFLWRRRLMRYPADVPNAAGPRRGPVGVVEPEVADLPALARTLGYVDDAGSADTAHFLKRTGPDADRQFCLSCRHYGGPAEVERAPCEMYAGARVLGRGWCSAWLEREI